MTELITKLKQSPNIKPNERYDVLKTGERLQGNIFYFPMSVELAERANPGIKMSDLPDGYGMIGGSARNYLEALTNPEMDIPLPRDIDLVYCGELDEFDTDVADELAQELAPRDFENGHGVQLLENVEEYMSDRDFTINQVLVTSDGVYATNQAIKDMKDYCIRPTPYEAEYGLSDKLALKAIRLLAEYRTDGVQASVEVEDLEENYDDIRPFWHALMLDKTLELGDDVASEYLRLLGKYNMRPFPNAEGYDDPMVVYKALLEWTDFVPSDAVQEKLDGQNNRERTLRRMGLTGVKISRG